MHSERYYLVEDGEIELNSGRRTVDIVVANTGDRPIQAGSHAHSFEVNRALRFDRAQTLGMRLDIPAGTAVRFEPGDEKPVTLVALGGASRPTGMNGLFMGAVSGAEAESKALAAARERGFLADRSASSVPPNPVGETFRSPRGGGGVAAPRANTDASDRSPSHCGDLKVSPTGCMPTGCLFEEELSR